MKSTQKILRREPESDSKGDLVGERALGWLAGTSKAQSPRVGYYSIFWTWDRDYWALTGEHLEDVLALERRLKAEAPALFGDGARTVTLPRLVNGISPKFILTC